MAAQLCLRWKKKKSQTTLTVYATHTKVEILETISTATFLNRERQRTSQCLNSGMNANALSTVASSVLSAIPAWQINAGFAVPRRLCDFEHDLKCVRQRSYCEGKA